LFNGYFVTIGTNNTGGLPPTKSKTNSKTVSSEWVWTVKPLQSKFSAP